ncbi:MAG: type IV toxin-antitoxin system AbiEi family antitoxin domain-containing protein [Acidimicrobiales bacterium]|nr:type IV toxin-antitoxin system AbiEi family antitoxin domain-containing protein [Acidimicrobiales bacterium]
MSQIDAAVAKLARRQHGVFTLRQLLSVGGTKQMARRRCERGVWRSPARGVLAITGVPGSFEQRVMIAILACGDGAIASHRTAAQLLGISSRTTAPIEVSVPYERNPKQRSVRCHRSRDLELAEVQVRNGIPTTGPARTILDLGAVAPALAKAAMWRAMRTDSLRWEDLLRTLLDHSRRGRPGLGVLRALIHEHYGTIAGDSDTEELAYQILLDSGRVPIPERLVPVVCADGVEVTVDFGWPDQNALVEVYGVDHLRNESKIQIDLHRANQIILAGYELLIYTGKMLARPDQFVFDVETMLHRRGWTPGAAA